MNFLPQCLAIWESKSYDEALKQYISCKIKVETTSPNSWAGTMQAIEQLWPVVKSEWKNYWSKQSYEQAFAYYIRQMFLNDYRKKIFDEHSSVHVIESLWPDMKAAYEIYMTLK